MLMNLLLAWLDYRKVERPGELQVEDVDAETLLARLEVEEKKLLKEIWIPGEGGDDENFGVTKAPSLCRVRKGTITHIYPNYGMIEDTFYFGLSSLPTPNTRVGLKVTFLSFRRKVGEEWRASKILKVVEEEPWSDDEEPVKPPHLESRDTMSRTHVGQVIKRRGRDILVTPDIRFCLDEVKSEFTPLPGDWLQLDVVTENDPTVHGLGGEVLAVDRVKALRSKKVDAVVTSWDASKGEGVLSGEIFMTKDACVSGYMPCLQDQVDAQVIESTQGKLSWRALSVSPRTEKDVTKSTEAKQLKLQRQLLSNKKGIQVSDNLNFGLLTMGEVKELKVKVTNRSSHTVTLLGGRFVGRSEQITLLRPHLKNFFHLNPKEKVTYQFQCEGKVLGYSSQLFIFEFEGFRIGRYLDVQVEEEDVVASIPSNPTNQKVSREKYDRCALARKMQVATKKGFLISGVRPIKPPAFVQVRLGMYPIPERLWAAVVGPDNTSRKLEEVLKSVLETEPCLKETLNITNYCNRMHTLLYLEEIEQTLRMRQYDMDGAKFIPVHNHNNEKFLMLKVTGLAEKRPSLMLGDRIIAINALQTKQGAPLQFEGFIHKVGANEVWLRFNNNFHASYTGGHYSVSFHFSRTPMRRCHAAVDLALKHMGPGVLFPNCVKLQERQLHFTEDNFDGDFGNMPQGEYFDSEDEDLPPRLPGLHSKRRPLVITTQGGGKKRFDEALVRRRRYRTLDSLPTPDPPKLKRNVVEMKWINNNLNIQQKNAVRNVLKGEARPLPYIIFGPPGTGKTITVVETVLQIFLLIPDARIVVATPSNSSANLIAERLLESGLLQPGDFVRLVGYHCLEENTLPQCLVPFSTTGDIRIARGSASLPTPVDERLKTSSNASTLGRHRITVGTCIALGQLYTMGFPRGHFTHVLVDEAGQATEPEILIPLGFLHTSWGQAVLAGDPLQLGPVVSSRVASNFGLGESFLARLLERYPFERDPKGYTEFGGYNPNLVTRLVMNYRSLPEILELPSDLFYDAQLDPQVSEETSEEAQCLRSLRHVLPDRGDPARLPPAVVFHGIKGLNAQDGDCPSWFNPQEVVCVVNYLKSIYEAGVKPEDIGVITPYQLQVQKMKQRLNRQNMPIPKIGSVEEFQGQERMIVILSAVRSTLKQANMDIHHALGFVASPHRLNVALTRARALLIIVGNPHLLAKDPYWRSSLLYCHQNNSYWGCDLPLELLDAFDI